ncbi:pyridoxal phosphate-dependent aminotransferase [Luteibaculum oceani]|uniref:Aminotransferase n=1 Tax=Luteibaculum oceani TaxID=1294296 RepID=A0A5C6V8D3_9FLAO|nr:pyridoxal phosphate-dependent aminotransferase [Luteibaculum oceani]TXC81612.1 pyridoxal phosphate-dependent aminotransferase [Luteibaculum oceani]
MPAISIKGQNMPESPIRKLVPFAEAAKKSGKKVYHLNIGQPDIPAPEVVTEVFKNSEIKHIEYSHSAGNESYRKGLTEYYAKYDISLGVEDILITTGGSEALIFALQSCLNPGDEIIIPEPFYANYNGFAVTAGIKVKPILSTIDNGFALPPVEEFEKLITNKTKAILICNPGNPTGYLYSQQEIEALKAIVKKHDLYLFADEVYREFCYDGATPFSTLKLEGVEDNVVVVDSVSKRYSMCGARIGAVVTRNKQLMQTILKFAQARLSPPSLGQIAGEAALKTPQSYFDNVVTEYTQRRKTLVDGLNKIDGVVCPNPGGAFYTVAKFPVKNAEHFCQWMLSEFEFEGATVMMAPASGFYATPNQGLDEVRIAYVLEVEALKHAVKCIEEGLKAYPNN